MLLRYLYDPFLSQASYLIGCQRTGQAAVIDPNRDVQEYLRLAASEGLRITTVTETHIHADFLSGSRELAARTEGRLYLSDEGGADWSYGFDHLGLHDGDVIQLGNVRLQARHTPGHTPEHLSFLLTDGATADRPMGLFTGDFVFVGDVGRPDLLEAAAGVAGTTEPAARQLYRSLSALSDLADYLQIWPGHGAGSACGKALGAVPSSTLGYERLFNWAFQVADEDAFVQEVLAGQPVPPRYFAEMKRANREGPRLLSERTPAKAMAAGELAAVSAEGALIVDTRPAAAFVRGHVPGSIALPWGPSFTQYAGMVLPYDRPIYLIAEAGALAAVGRELARIGLDDVAGYWTTEALVESGAATASLPEIDVRDLSERRLAGQDGTVLDVRLPSEYDQGHLEGSRLAPLQNLADHLDEIPRDGPVYVHCRTGVRSLIATSLLAARGDHAVNVRGGITAWQRAGLPVEHRLT